MLKTMTVIGYKLQVRQNISDSGRDCVCMMFSHCSTYGALQTGRCPWVSSLSGWCHAETTVDQLQPV